MSRDKKSFIRFESKIPSAEIALFARQLATMISSGIPLKTAIESISKEHDNQSFRKILKSIINNLNRGHSFSDCLKEHQLFDTLFCNLIKAGEESGTLESMLSRLSIYHTKKISINNKIKKSFIYPLAIIGITLLVSSLLLLVIVPEFEILFSSFNAKLPTLTRIIITISAILQRYWWIFIASTLFFIVIFKNIIYQNHAFKHFLDTTLLKIPFLGTNIKKATIAQVFSTLSILLSAGITLTDAIALITQLTHNSVFQIILREIHGHIIAGESLHNAFKKTLFFQNRVITIIDAGEQSGALEPMLLTIASLYEEEVDLFLNTLTQLIEPIIMLILGTLVGIFVLALYLPIFKLGSVF